MEEIEKLLYECEKRMEETSDLIMQNMKEDTAKELVDKLLEGAKVMDEIKIKAHRHQTAIDNCKLELSQAEEPWNFNVHQMYKKEFEKASNEKQKKKKNKGLYQDLKKHVDTQDEVVMEVDKQENQPIDPWTRTPILQPMQSTTCKHLYDKKSINCIIKNRNQFKCPYIGCQSVITKDQLIDVGNSED